MYRMSNGFKITIATIFTILNIPLFGMMTLGAVLSGAWGPSCGVLACATFGILGIVGFFLSLFAYVLFLRKKHDAFLYVTTILTIVGIFLMLLDAA
jgi:hypothetical protein